MTPDPEPEGRGVIRCCSRRRTPQVPAGRIGWSLHIVLPVVSTAALIYVTIKSFQPFPGFPYNRAPLIDGIWLAIGLVNLGGHHGLNW